MKMLEKKRLLILNRVNALVRPNMMTILNLVDKIENNPALIEGIRNEKWTQVDVKQVVLNILSKIK